MPDEGKMLCRRCGKKSYKAQLVVETEIKQEVEEIPVIDIEKQKKKISTIKEPCPRCGVKKAIWWMQQTRGVDEPATRFFKCIKCGHAWREYK